jgi:mono/diheme cytochrome c family protein
MAKTIVKRVAVAMAGALVLGVSACQVYQTEQSDRSHAVASSYAAANAKTDEAASREAFLAAYTVLMHPRCMNCHPNGDVPLQGDDSRLHIQNVKRGPDGKGLFALKCANCHQDQNLAGANMPPGNPNWHLPPANMRMVFEGKSPAQLARQLKDPKQNGGKTLEQILHHSAHDKLVAWGWDPGDGRTKPPLSHEEFAAKMREWIEKGAAIPE